MLWVISTQSWFIADLSESLHADVVYVAFTVNIGGT